jgi:SRSO17 transposase
MGLSRRTTNGRPAPTEEKNDTAALKDAARLFMEFCQTYSPHFMGWGMNSVGHARHYLSGLLGTQRRKNIEVIGQDVKGSDYQGLEQFISASPWDHREVMDQVAGDADVLLGDEQRAGLYIDESSFLKKGHASVGVQRQWSGRAGKVENCQIGVYACLGRDQRACLTDFRLYLPQGWTQDPARLDKAKVPVDHREHQTKHEQALAMIVHARQQGLRFGWVGFDCLYGSKRELLDAVEDLGERFVGDVSKTTKVWTRRPGLETPQAKRGRPARHPRLSPAYPGEYRSVESLAQEHFETSHQKVKYRAGTKGALWTRIWVSTVWTWEPGSPQPRERLLIIRGDADQSFKYSLSNLAAGQAWSHYAWVQAQRFWIEHAFHEAKSQLGMAQYQVRVWRGWHHHMALVAMALLFSQKLCTAVQTEVPLLSVRDITELLDYYLPRQRVDENAVLTNIAARHRLRTRDLKRRKRQRTGPPLSI